MPPSPTRKRGRSDFVRSLTANSAGQPPPGTSPRPSALESPSSQTKPSTPSAPIASPAASAMFDKGAGAILLTNVVHSIDYLKEKRKPISFDNLCNYLSLDTKPETSRLRPSLAAALQTDPRVQYTPPDPTAAAASQAGGDDTKIKAGPAAGKKTAGGGGMYQFKPKHNVRAAADLIGQLQQQQTAKGISVKDLKEGWAEANTAIELLEQKYEILVARQKKDHAPRMVWLDDSTIRPRLPELDPEFVTLWHSFKLPDTDEELSKKLEDVGIKATSAAGQAAERARRAKAMEDQRLKKKKRGGPRAGGRVTNDHMSWALRDYSTMRK